MIDFAKVLGVDFGKARIGLAVGHESAGMAFPLTVISNKGERRVFDSLIEICAKNGCGTVLVGLPLDLRAGGGRGESDVLKLINIFVDNFRLYIRELKDSELSAIQVKTFDEALSSFEAGDAFRQNLNVYGSKKNTGLDAYAAQVILQRYFDSL